MYALNCAHGRIVHNQSQVNTINISKCTIMAQHELNASISAILACANFNDEENALWTKLDWLLSLTTQDNHLRNWMVHWGDSRGGIGVWDSPRMSLMDILDFSNECHSILNRFRCFFFEKEQNILCNFLENQLFSNIDTTVWSCMWWLNDRDTHSTSFGDLVFLLLFHSYFRNVKMNDAKLCVFGARKGIWHYIVDPHVTLSIMNFNRESRHEHGIEHIPFEKIHEQSRTHCWHMY